MNKELAIECIKTQRQFVDDLTREALDIAIDLLKQPERKKGHWIDAVIPNDSGGLPVIVCDKCNTFFPLQFGASHNFYPNCGADMRGEHDE